MAIKLEKSGDSHRINLNKANSTEAVSIHVNLDWDEAKKKKGFFGSIFGGSGKNLDLDLGCMYQLQNGSIGVIQALGESFGSKVESPFIYLDRDDRSGATDGENMFVLRPDLIRKVMVFAYIYGNDGDFEDVNGRVRFKSSDGQEVYIDLDSPDSQRNFCAMATITLDNGKIMITKQEKYFKGHQQADEHFGFGFNWVSGSKR